ncbi:hypothetical protein KU73_15890 [Pectobacterium wasabiae]|uniref:Uncharacterized protein n=1 Tax=Pectobacterium wasabiae TaxID=55208 RepID=A0AAW3EFQ0_9GAMM|nr:hypothetical protein A7983_05830 [Pectobacterium wasabiae CFBP 3304]KFX04597.1 hypothetical protein JV38_15900 [Pectobacterium wasabiae]KGA27617.1 hypothetical protein KU73_15890 [Pectobacterium wasabiae]
MPDLDESHGDYKQMQWLDDFLGENFICYIEWKEFDPRDLGTLVPIKQSGVSLSVDSLFDDEGCPVGDIDPEEIFYDAPGFFLPVLQQQLQQVELQLLEVGLIQDGGVYLHENSRLICTTTNKEKVEQLNQCLQQRGLVLC